LFLSKLACSLDGSTPDWRDNSLILMDNASYNTCRETQNHMKWLNMPYMFTGPYSYDGAPVELLFALFKRVNINPDGLATGKK
jgi:transposase